MSLSYTFPFEYVCVYEEKSSMGGLKSYTAYLVNVIDFGRAFTIERRFDDFQQLHLSVSEIDKCALQLHSTTAAHI